MSALVTGAFRGIGAEVARRLAREGHVVAAVDVHDPDATVADIVEAGGRAVAIRGDVRDFDAMGDVVRRVEDELGPIEAAASVAGVWQYVRFLDLDPTTWSGLLDVNLTGMFNVCRHVGAARAPRRRRAMVCMSSNAATLAWDGGAHYSASKAGILGLVKGMAFELGPLGIRVNAICPGTIRTPATEPELTDPEAEAEQVAAHRLGRLGLPTDVAEAVAFLLDPVRAAWITGDALYVDGGFGTHGEGAGFGVATDSTT